MESIRKLSIITPCFRSAQTLEKTILSVLGQGYPNLEYIIVDGGSQDGTLDIIRKYQDKITNWISEPDKGVYDAMNKGIRMATGDWIGIINSDDYYLPGVFEKINLLAGQGGAEILYADIRMNFLDRRSYVYRSAPLLSPGKFWKMPIQHPTVFVKREVYEQDGLFQETYRIGADYALILKLFMKGRRFRYVREVWVEMEPGGLSDDRWLEGKREIRKAAREYGIFAFPMNAIFHLDNLKTTFALSLQGVPVVNRVQRFYRNSKTVLLKRG